MKWTEVGGISNFCQSFRMKLTHITHSTFNTQKRHYYRMQAARDYLILHAMQNCHHRGANALSIRYTCPNLIHFCKIQYLRKSQTKSCPKGNSKRANQQNNNNRKNPSIEWYVFGGLAWVTLRATAAIGYGIVGNSKYLIYEKIKNTKYKVWI